jgi:hypothetical protein
MPLPVEYESRDAPAQQMNGVCTQYQQPIALLKKRAGGKLFLTRRRSDARLSSSARASAFRRPDFGAVQ